MSTIAQFKAALRGGFNPTLIRSTAQGPPVDGVTHVTFIGQLCRVGDSPPYAWYVADTLDTWVEDVLSGGGGGGLSDAPTDGHPYLRKDGAWLRAADSAVYPGPIFATHVTDISGWSIAGDDPALDGSGNVTFLNPASVTEIDNCNNLGSGATLDFSVLTGLLTIGGSAFSSQYNLTGDLVLCNPLVSIGEYAFYYCTGLTSVTIPSGVTSLGNYAFSSCSGLTSVTIPNSVTTIGESAFLDCSGLTSVTIGTGVTSIGDYAFSGCDSLTSVTIPNSVTSIEWGAFSSCTGLTSVSIGTGVTSIGQGAFFNCSGLTSITCLAMVAPTLGDDYVFDGIAGDSIWVLPGATGYGTTYGGLTVNEIL